MSMRFGSWLDDFYHGVREGLKRPSTCRREEVEPALRNLEVAQDLLHRVSLYGSVPPRMSLWLGDMDDYVNEMRAIIGGDYVKRGPEKIEEMLNVLMTDYVNRAMYGINKEIDQIPQEQRENINTAMLAINSAMRIMRRATHNR